IGTGWSPRSGNPLSDHAERADGEQQNAGALGHGGGEEAVCAASIAVTSHDLARGVDILGVLHPCRMLRSRHASDFRSLPDHTTVAVRFQKAFLTWLRGPALWRNRIPTM